MKSFSQEVGLLSTGIGTWISMKRISVFYDKQETRVHAVRARVRPSEELCLT